MAQPARRPPELDELDGPPVFDPSAIDRAYRFHRARRHARTERRRATQLARLRFWFVLGALFLACLVIVVTIWREVERLFGL
jgi:hypothetical protein